MLKEKVLETRNILNANEINQLLPILDNLLINDSEVLCCFAKKVCCYTMLRY